MSRSCEGKNLEIVVLNCFVLGFAVSNGLTGPTSKQVTKVKTKVRKNYMLCTRCVAAQLLGLPCMLGLRCLKDVCVCRMVFARALSPFRNTMVQL